MKFGKKQKSKLKIYFMKFAQLTSSNRPKSNIREPLNDSHLFCLKTQKNAQKKTLANPILKKTLLSLQHNKQKV